MFLMLLLSLQMESSRSGFDEEDAIDEKFYTGKEEYMTEKKKQEMEMEQAIKAQKRWTQITSTCPYCYGSSQMSKDNLMLVFDLFFPVELSGITPISRCARRCGLMNGMCRSVRCSTSGRKRSAMRK